MGEYASIMIGDYILYSFKNYLDNYFVSLFFSKNSLTIKEIKNNPSQKYDKCIYKSTVKESRERLDCLGYSLKNFELLFNNLDYECFEYDPKLLEKINYSETKLQAIRNKNITFKKWMNSLSKVINYEISKNENIHSFGNDYPSELITTFCDKLIIYSLLNDFESLYAIKFTVPDLVPFVYRAILEFFDENESIELDFTDLQFWDEKSITSAISNEDWLEKTIVLVEGVNDKKILDFSIKHLFPHLSDLIYIMDFEFNGNKRNGGSSFINSNFRTFYYAHIKSKIVALFDNDAQGCLSEFLLYKSITRLPKNMRIMRYPNLKEFKKYPTISPNNKIVNDDINKRAASIELYLPDFFIKDGNNYIPIEWESRVEIKDNSNKYYIYQGAITQKGAVQDKVDNYIKQVNKGIAQFNDAEWDRMKTLLTALLFAFK